MDIFGSLAAEYEHVAFAHDPATGLRTIIAVHSTALGPALGGTRFYPFASEDAALRDVLRLAKAMSYKNACAGLECGGGKAVIIGDPHTLKTPALLQAYGRVVERLGGSYLTTADVGTNASDMVQVATTTRFVTGTPSASGDPSPNTSYGVWWGIQAVAQRLWGSTDLHGVHVLVQGTGKVGSGLVDLLHASGAQLSISDIDTHAAEALAARTGATLVAPDEALRTKCDILAPCALGPVVTDQTLPQFACAAIAGAANNQLGLPQHADKLAQQGILYAPDYVINAGGVINVAGEIMGYDGAEARSRAEAIATTLTQIFERSTANGTTPAAEADSLAQERIGAVARRFGGAGGSR